MNIHKKINTLVVLLMLLSSFSYAQDSIVARYPMKHKISDAEKLLMKDFHSKFQETAPPDASVRSIAEWEPTEGLKVVYDNGFGVPYSFLSEVSKNNSLITIVNDANEEQTVRNLYTSNAVNLENCTFIHHRTDSWWIRDYSPWYIAVDEQKIALVDFPYNRPRPNDNALPAAVANALNTELYAMNLIHTGGNYMSDGLHSAASTDLVLEEAEQNEDEVREIMRNYLGVNNYHITPDPLGDYIKHIDCWGKFLAPDKILITQVPADDPRYYDYEAVAEYFSNQESASGQNYQVLRVQAAHKNQYETNPYTNSLILNGQVFVPVSGSNYDAAALEVYREAMPAYEIAPVYFSGWYNTDALHCRTHAIADRQMLSVIHKPLLGEQAFQTHYSIDAKISSYGNSTILEGSPVLYYQKNNGEQQQVIMEQSRKDYSAAIPSDNGSHTVSYYIEAANNYGKTITHPIGGADNPHIFTYSSSADASNKAAAEISIYPNPTRGKLFVNNPPKNTFYRLYNMSGQLLVSGNISVGHKVIDIAQLPPGLYVLKLYNTEWHFFEKIMLR